MNAKTRIQKLEKTNTADKPGKIIVMYDSDVCGGGLATFDGVKMTQAEAEAKAAAQPENVLVIRVCYASQDKGGDA